MFVCWFVVLFECVGFCKVCEIVWVCVDGCVDDDVFVNDLIVKYLEF